MLTHLCRIFSCVALILLCGAVSAFELEVTDADGGGPLAGVAFDAGISLRPKGFKEIKGTTDAKGVLKIEVPPEASSFEIIPAAGSGYAPSGYQWKAGKEQKPVPEKAALKLVKGVEIGGIVNGPDGSPLAGVEILLTFELLDEAYEPPLCHAWDLEARSGPDGKWTARVNPAMIAAIDLEFSHAGYLGTADERVEFEKNLADSKSDLLAKSHRTILELEKKAPAAATVKDNDGRPVPGATVWFLTRRQCLRATTGEDGKATAPEELRGNLIVIAGKKGFACTEVPSANPNGFNAALTLQEGAAVKGRVVDAGGKPVEGVAIRKYEFDTDNELGGALTGADGNFEIRAGKVDKPVWTIHKEGFIRYINARLGPDSPNIITLYPVITLRGKVTDDAGSPITSFRLSAGKTMEKLFTSPDGSYSFPLTILPFEQAVSGIKPLETAITLADGRKTKATLKPVLGQSELVADFVVAAPKQLKGIVLDPDGKAVADAEVSITSRKSSDNEIMRKAVESRPDNPALAPPKKKKIASGNDGTFKIDVPEKEKFLVSAAHPSGYGELLCESPPDKEVSIQLKSWGGLVLKWPKEQTPKTGTLLVLERPVPGLDRLDKAKFTVGADGTLTVEKAPPGPARLSCPGLILWTEILPGQKTETCLPDSGATVSGSLKFEGAGSFQALRQAGVELSLALHPACPAGLDNSLLPTDRDKTYISGFSDSSFSLAKLDPFSEKDMKIISRLCELRTNLAPLPAVISGDGYFVFKNVQAGEYRIKGSISGTPFDFGKLEVPSDKAALKAPVETETKPIPMSIFPLKPSGKFLTGTVVDAEGAPVSDAILRFDCKSGAPLPLSSPGFENERPPHFTARPAEDGSFSIAIPEDAGRRLSIFSEKHGCASCKGNVELPDGRAQLLPWSSINGKIGLPAREKDAGCNVSYADENGTFSDMRAAGEEGNFKFQKVPSGKGKLIVFISRDDDLDETSLEYLIETPSAGTADFAVPGLRTVKGRLGVEDDTEKPDYEGSEGVSLVPSEILPGPYRLAGISAELDGNGIFTFIGVPPGKYTLKAACNAPDGGKVMQYEIPVEVPTAPDKSADEAIDLGRIKPLK